MREQERGRGGGRGTKGVRDRGREEKWGGEGKKKGKEEGKRERE